MMFCQSRTVHTEAQGNILSEVAHIQFVNFCM